MSLCSVTIRGKDGQIRSMTLDASSTFDAAYKAVQRWALLWWFSPDSIITVRHGDQKWRVSQERLREWQKSQK